MVAGVVPTVRGAIGVRYSQSLGPGGVPNSARLELELPGNLPAMACAPLSACPGNRVVLDGAIVDADVRGDYACVNITALSVPRVLSCPAA